MFTMKFSDDVPGTNCQDIVIRAKFISTVFMGEDERIKALSSFCSGASYQLDQERIATLLASSTLAILKSFYGEEEISDDFYKTVMKLTSEYAIAAGMVKKLNAIRIDKKIDEEPFKD